MKPEELKNRLAALEKEISEMIGRVNQLMGRKQELEELMTAMETPLPKEEIDAA